MVLAGLRDDAQHREVEFIEPVPRGDCPPELAVLRVSEEGVEEVSGWELAFHLPGPVALGHRVGAPHSEEACVEQPTLPGIVAIEIGRSVDRGDAFEVGWLLKRGQPLHDPEVGVAQHRHAAVAPRLLGDPLDHVEAVLLLFDRKRRPLPLREPGSSRRNNHVHVAVWHEERGSPGLDRVRDRRRPLLNLLDVRRHRQDPGVLPRLLRAVDIGSDANAVAHRDVHVLLEDDPLRQRRSNGRHVRLHRWPFTGLVRRWQVFVCGRSRALRGG